MPDLIKITVSFDQVHLMENIINNNKIKVHVVDSNNSLMDDIVKYNKQWKTIIKTIIKKHHNKVIFESENTKQRLKDYTNARLSVLPPTTENPLTGKVHRVRKKSSGKKSSGKKSSGKKSSGKKSPDKNPAVDIVAANLDRKILEYIGGSGRKMKSRKIRKNNTSKTQNNKTLRSK